MEMNQSVENNFKFGVYIGDKTLCETIHNANFFSPPIRNFVNIKDNIFYIISKLQKLLSQKTYDYTYESLNFKNYKKSEIEKYCLDIQNQIKSDEKPNAIINDFNKNVKGIECKFGFYINKKTIVERNFYVKHYNSDVCESINIVDCCNDILNDIISDLRELDVIRIWDDCQLIEKLNISITDLRFNISESKRNRLLEKIYK